MTFYDYEEKNHEVLYIVIWSGYCLTYMPTHNFLSNSEKVSVASSIQSLFLHNLFLSVIFSPTCFAVDHMLRFHYPQEYFSNN